MARTLASDGWVHHLPFHHVEFQRHNYFVLDTISLFLSFSSFSLIRTRTCVRSSASCLGSVSVPVAYLGMGRAWGSGAVETHQQKEHIRTLGGGRRERMQQCFFVRKCHCCRLRLRPTPWRAELCLQLFFSMNPRSFEQSAPRHSTMLGISPRFMLT